MAHQPGYAFFRINPAFYIVKEGLMHSIECNTVAMLKTWQQPRRSHVPKALITLWRRVQKSLY